MRNTEFHANEALAASVIDRQIEQVYRLVPILGVERAIAEVAGDCYVEATDSFEPDFATRITLRDRYAREMAEFTANGGY